MAIIQPDRIAPSQIGAIFDCDGTLVDSMGVWRELEGSLVESVGRELTDQERSAIAPMTIPECGIYFHDQLGVGESPAAVVDYINDFMYDYYAHRTSLRPGARAFLTDLAALGVPMTIASSTPHALLEAAFDAAGVSSLFRAILSVDDVGASKRDPLIFETAREAMGTAKALTWGFEDSIYAVNTLKQAGFKTVGVYDCDTSGTFEELSATAVKAIRSFEDLDAVAFLTLAGASL